MHIWGKGRAADRVGSDFLSAIAGRVGSTFCRVGSGPRKVTRGQLWSSQMLSWLTVYVLLSVEQYDNESAFWRIIIK